mmetsp:Transcript_28/g.28  ORF Transcript_28/g.28 Transcript_28/m.28 type:complete len:112 (+) Transcript_28:47-382(+)
MSKALLGKPIYVRIRRKKQTFYIFCKKDEHTPEYLKEEVYRTMNQFDEEYTDENDEHPEMKLIDSAGQEIKDCKNLTNEQELFLVFRLTDDEFEPVDVSANYEDVDSTMEE